jgi:hypothetical protein
MSGYAQWNPATTYVVNDIVAFDGVLYIALLISTNRQPNSNPTFWATTGASSAITSIVAGNGISVAGTTAITVTNNISAGNGIAISGTNPLAITNNISAGNGIAISGTNPLAIANNITAGAGISITGTNPLTIASSVSGGVRNNTAQTFSYNPSSPALILSSANPVRNVFTIPLNASFTGCNSFTFFIRTLQVISTTNTGTSLQFNFYPRITASGQQDIASGATSYAVFTVPSTSTTTTLTNLTWNWAPTPPIIGNTIYFNIDAVLLSPNQISVTNVDINFDVVGNVVTLSSLT